MSSSAGPSLVSRPRRSSALTSNGSAASSTGTADGARIGGSLDILMSGDCEVMALYLGSVMVNRKALRESEMFRSPSRRRPGTITPSFGGEASLTTLQERDNTAYGPGLRRDDGVDVDAEPFTIPPQNTRLECPFARADDFQPRR